MWIQSCCQFMFSCQTCLSRVSHPLAAGECLSSVRGFFFALRNDRGLRRACWGKVFERCEEERPEMHPDCGFIWNWSGGCIICHCSSLPRSSLIFAGLSNCRLQILHNLLRYHMHLNGIMTLYILFWNMTESKILSAFLCSYICILVFLATLADKSCAYGCTHTFCF